jgi:DNA primase
VTIEHHIIEASIRWPGLEFKKKTGDEASAPCPFCNQGIDRFLIFADGGYWCRQCNAKGWIDEEENHQKPSRQEMLERRIAQIERRQKEHERRINNLEIMHRSQDHVRYHQALTDDTLEYWLSEGIEPNTVDRYLLGYCESCPTFRQSASYTIPVINRSRLENIRHRLVSPNGTGKYRPHMKNLGNPLFNVDLLDDAKERILIVEGEKKSIVLAQAGFPNVGITGKRSFKKEWLPWFDHVQEIVVCLDPDATESAYRLAGIFGERARVAAPPVKIDDAIVRYGAGAKDIEAMIGWARGA